MPRKTLAQKSHSIAHAVQKTFKCSNRRRAVSLVIGLALSLTSTERVAAAPITATWNGTDGQWTDSTWDIPGNVAFFPNNTGTDQFNVQIDSGKVGLSPPPPSISINALTNNASVTISGGAILTASSVSNTGTVKIDNARLVADNYEQSGDSVTLVRNAGIANSNGLAVNTIINLKSGAKLTLDQGEVRAGQLNITGPEYPNGPSSKVEGNGLLAGSAASGVQVVVDGGALSPGLSIGQLTIDGQLSVASGTIQIDIGGATNYDHISVLDSAIFTGGEILFKLLEGFLPKAGDTLDFFSAPNTLDVSNMTFGISGGIGDFTVSTNGPSGGLEFVALNDFVPLSGGLWQEFSFIDVGIEARGCYPADSDATALDCEPSSGGNSVFANAPPWAFYIPDGGASLVVTDAFTTGDAFQILDNGISLGATPIVSPTGDCGDDPDVCLADPLVSHGKFALPSGRHSITIMPTAAINAGAAYFRFTALVPEPPTWYLLLIGAISLARKPIKLRRGYRA